MGKNDFLTPKAIGNRIKAKGLQKLKWFCQMCQKQCRDENGFKCHLSSDTHRRQMEVFGQDPDRVIEGYSEEFLRTFLEFMLSAYASPPSPTPSVATNNNPPLAVMGVTPKPLMGHPKARVYAHKAYNEYIQDKYHIHMNSTSWHTLSEFVTYLGREGHCKVEDTPKGWLIAVIHRDTDAELLEAEREKRRAKELLEETREQKELNAQIARARAKDLETAGPPDADATPAGPSSGPSSGALDRAARVPGDLRRAPDAAPLQLKLAAVASEGPAGSGSVGSGVKRIAGDAFSDASADLGPGATGSSRKRTKMEEIMEREQTRKAAAQAADAALAAPQENRPWLAKGLVVKVMAKGLKDAGYYKQKGRVVKVLDQYIGEVEMLDDGAIVRVDQAELETVIPKPGGVVMVVGGRYRGVRGTVQELLVDKFQAAVLLATGAEVLEEYENVCKIA